MKDATMTNETVYDNNATVNSEVETELQAELLDMYRRKGPDNYFFASLLGTCILNLLLSF